MNAWYLNWERTERETEGERRGKGRRATKSRESGRRGPNWPTLLEEAAARTNWNFKDAQR